ncbi:MAG TPA: hypothetical protein VJ371_11695, partial [Streptosporangiaceae bacterium]|nr:hypothetical protein [Streptosporangiaceae bacterium]
PCPCAVRHATAARTRVLSALAVAGLTALAVLCVSGPAVQAQPTASSASLPAGHGGGSAVERITLIVIAVLAVGVFTVLQFIARSQRRRWSAFADWRTWPPGFDPWAGRGDPVAGQHEGSAYRPGYGFLPGHGRGSGVVPETRRETVPEARKGIVPEARRETVPEARLGRDDGRRQGRAGGARWYFTA